MIIDAVYCDEYTIIGGGAHQLLVVGGEDGEARAGDEVVVEAAGHLRHGQDREYLLIDRPAHWTVQGPSLWL